jgi:hypothetical protein
MPWRFIGAEIEVVQNPKLRNWFLDSLRFLIWQLAEQRRFFLFILRIIGVLGGLWRSVGLVVVSLLVFVVFQRVG